MKHSISKKDIKSKHNGSKASKNTIQEQEMPSISQIENAINYEKYKKKYKATIKNTIYVLITVAAIAVLVATLWLPVLKIYGTSMSPTFEPGDIIVSVKKKKFNVGDVIAFYYENKVLVKRYIAGPGDWVNIDDEGNVSVNGEKLNETYVKEKSFEPCDIEFPYQVPDNKYFVLGDNRSTSIDSRSSSVGCISQEQLVGNIVFRIWPLTRFGSVEKK